MSVILSGIQPSGVLHLGNYLGAIKQWQKVLKKSNNDTFYFMVADLHSLTTSQNAVQLKNDMLYLLASYIACGISVENNANLFIQSSISAHSELAWILSTITPFGMLERMTQFKDKSAKSGASNANCGLFTYPVLMAADILLYDTTHVPVGDDQKQHLEFTRDIAQKFNHHYNCDVFTVPDFMSSESASRVMSLQDGTKKMSKSSCSDAELIKLNDTNDEISKKIKSAKTDSIRGIYYDKENRPEVSNLIEIMSSISGSSKKEIEDEYRNLSTKDFKDNLMEIIINEIAPIREKLNILLQDKDALLRSVEVSSARVKDVATNKIKQVKQIVGVGI